NTEGPSAPHFSKERMEDMSEMVERVARAIALKMIHQNHMLELCVRDDCGAVGVYDEYDNKFYDCEELARASMGAMREPTDAMVDAGQWQIDPVTLYQSFIDDALREE